MSMSHTECGPHECNCGTIEFVTEDLVQWRDEYSEWMCESCYQWIEHLTRVR